jgi:hypothetical protein
MVRRDAECPPLAGRPGINLGDFVGTLEEMYVRAVYR